MYDKKIKINLNEDESEWMTKAMKEMGKKLNAQIEKNYFDSLMYCGVPVKVDQSLPDSHPGYMIAHNLGPCPIAPGTIVHVAPDSLHECPHEWRLDYTSPFVKKDYYSCRHCGKKQEEV